MDRTRLIAIHHDRKGAVADAVANIQTYGRARALDVAGRFDRTGDAIGHCDLINVVMREMIALCYKRDAETDRHENIDSITGQILFAVPWGRSYYHWELKSTEAEFLRRHMKTLQTGKPLFIYDAAMKRWRITGNYLYLQDAHAYWDKRKPTATQWVQYAEDMREKRRNRAK